MSIAVILAHPQLSHAQAIEICRRDGLRIVQTKRGNFIYESSTTSRSRLAVPLPDRMAETDVAAGPLEAS